MTEQGSQRDEAPRPVGRPLHALSVVSLGFVVIFVALILMLLVADVVYLVQRHIELPEGIDLWGILTSEKVLSGIRLSLLTSTITLVLVLVFAVPVGYALSRYRFRGHAILNTLVDVPIVLPPVVIGVSLLALLGTPVGGWINDGLKGAGWRIDSAMGIVACQFLVSVSYCIRATKASFDAVDRRLEHVALTLGCSRWNAFRRVTLPVARSGLIAGGVMAWARAIGVFGPLMIFVGTAPRVVVMPTAIWLELNTGDVEVSLVIALVAVTLAGTALAMVHWLAPGRKWT